MNDTQRSGQLRELVRHLERKLSILENGEMSCCGVSMAQCHALVEIGRAGSISLVDLSRLLNLDNSTLSRTVNNLVDNKMAERELDPNDRRYVVIKLSPTGVSAFQEIESNMGEYFLQVFEGIPEDKKDQVLDSLQLLTKAISEIECCF